MFKIKGKEVNLFFGMKFLEEIEKEGKVVELNETLSTLLATAVYDQNLLSISKILKAALSTQKDISKNDIDEYLESEATDEDIEKLVGFIKNTAKACRATKKLWKTIEKLMKEAEEKGVLPQ